MKIKSSTAQRFFETALTAGVLLILLVYTYAMFFLVPYAGFQFNVSTSEITDIFVAQQQSPRLELGDRLISINKVALEDYVKDFHMPLPTIALQGQIIPLLVEGPQGVKTIAWQESGFTSTEFLARLLNTWLLSFVFWLAGTATWLLVRPKNERWALLIAFYYITAIWLIAGSISASHIFASPFVLRAGIWMSLPIYLHLHWNFPRPLGRISPRLWTAFYVACGGLAALQWLGALPNGTYVVPFALAIFGSALMLLYRFIFRAGERREIGLLFLAVVIAFVPALIVAVASTQQGLTSASAGFLFSLLTMPGAYFYVVYRRQLGGSELRANRLISVYLFLILILTVAVAVLPLFSAQLENKESVGASILLTGVAAALASVFGFPHFQRFVERRLLHISQPPESLARAFAGRLSTSFTRENLVNILQKEVLPSLLIRQSALVSYEDKAKNEAIYLQGVKFSELPAAGQQKQLIDSLSQQQDQSIIPQEDGWLRLAVPLRVGKQTLGLWLLGRKDPDDYYSYAERALLESLTSQMAIALVNISQAHSLRALYQVDIERQEEERVHLARELHDDVLHQLNELVIEAGDQVQTRIFDQKHHKLDDRIRAMIHGLRPPMLSYGLYHALHELVDDLVENPSSKVELELSLRASETRYEARIEQHVYRIVQQACENAIAHGKAKHILVSGQCGPQAVDLLVEDDGLGFNLDGGTELTQLLHDRHFGLAGMNERAALIGARLEIESTLGKGTRIHLHWRAEGRSASE